MTPLPPATTRILPPVYFLLAIAAMFLLDYYLPVEVWVGKPLSYVGYVPIVAGLMIGLVGNLQFKRHKTPVKPFQTSTTVVTDGVFRFSRNPMYLGMVLILAGSGAVLGSLSPLIVVPLFIWRLQSRFILHEEAWMEQQFGEKYLRYKRRVRRWI